jgi:hypothetical protein
MVIQEWVIHENNYLLSWTIDTQLQFQILTFTFKIYITTINWE